MLELKLKNTNTINTEGNRVYLEDATGTYNSVTNTTGYGTPNAERDTMAILILGLNKTSKGDVAIPFESYNPLTADRFNAIISRDGWYQFNMISLPLYVKANLDNYVAGTVLYDAIYGTVVKITDTVVEPLLLVTPQVSTPLVEQLPTVDDEPIPVPEEYDGPALITIPITIISTQPQLDALVSTPTPTPTVTYVREAKVIELIDLKESQYIFSSTDTLFVANNSKTKIRLNTLVSELIYEEKDFNDKKLIRAKDNYNLLRAVLQGAIYEFCRGNKFVAQRDIEFLNTNNYVLD